jgi:hypothetical protein
MTYNSPHTFHIPVMGLAYTVDSPIKVARFGISSVISIVEDRLIEMMRQVHYTSRGTAYKPISTKEPDYRAKRITDYLNLVNEIVQTQIEKIKEEAFEKGAEIVKYFEMLPDDSKLKNLYLQFLQSKNEKEKQLLELKLRSKIVAGSIDVNVMTKTDRNNYNKQGELVEDGSDAVAALRGYVNSTLTNSSIVFSAGMNPRLYNYLENCNQFDADEDGIFKKKVIIKVSDYRSAIIQGKYLAKKGIWVSEFRIESGLNCGGHAFATDGFLLGPILQEFKEKKEQLIAEMFSIYTDVLKRKGRKVFKYAPQVQLSVQGGIGTAQEDAFLRSYYNVASTGWGSPFLLVPEATTVDDPTLTLLADSKEADVVLSNNSPLGVRFYYLNNTTSHHEKLKRIESGKPGSPCTEKHLAFNTEFTDKPICTASHQYQKLKIAQIRSLDLPANQLEAQLRDVTSKECLCIGLSNSASARYDVPFIKNLNAVTICPGPNIAYFNKQVTLRTMVDHIYGRTDIITATNRPHVFAKELQLYINYLREQLNKEAENNPSAKPKKQLIEFYKNLLSGISYYRNLPGSVIENKAHFDALLNASIEQLELVNKEYHLIEENAFAFA